MQEANNAIFSLFSALPPSPPVKFSADALEYEPSKVALSIQSVPSPQLRGC